MRVAVVAICLASCGSPQPPLYPAGSDKDDGHGELARASAQFLTAGDDDDLYAASQRARRDPDGAYGGDGYGGTSYGGFVPPQWTYPTVNRTPKYNQTTGLSGAVEGVVSWRGAMPGKRTTTCGAIEPLHVGGDRGLGDVLVYIERVQVGRTLPMEGRPATVGGIVVKRGCALVPTVQIVTPLPAALTIHGDGKPTKLRVTTSPSTGKLVELQEGARAAMQVSSGVTRIDAEDGSLASAWVHALDTPYYALTDDRGRYRIDELAPGTYDITFWQAPIAEAGIGTVKYGEPIVVHRTVKVETAKTARLDVALGR
ncbi:MAG TPA: carboxypeptidase-like regulatory domain-containing protein [Kofleriaceae bacterium]|nr:carboxypeptidase-like regulatory domain-containing protein [Kofleriaceae bacterium]